MILGIYHRQKRQNKFYFRNNLIKMFLFNDNLDENMAIKDNEFRKI